MLAIFALAGFAHNDESLTAAQSTSTCKVEQFIWKNFIFGGGKLMSIKGVVTAPVTVQLIHLSFYDNNDKFLGVSSALINPGGSFKEFLSWQNPTSKLKITYQCQQIG